MSKLKDPFYLRQDALGEEILLDLGAYECALFSRKSPSKDSGNEDMAAVVPLGQEHVVLIVADGMGGHRCGAEASQIACEEIVRFLLKAQAKDIIFAAQQGVESAHKKIIELGVGAGTTVAMVEVKGGQIRTIHVGDSQIISFGRRGKIKMLTTNHSPQGFALAAGLSDSRENFDVDQKHLLCNALGLDGMTLEISMPTEYSKRDTILLSSDGVYEHFENEELVKIGNQKDIMSSLKLLSEKITDRRQDKQASSYGFEDDWTAIMLRRKSGTTTPASIAS